MLNGIISLKSASAKTLLVILNANPRVNCNLIPITLGPASSISPVSVVPQPDEPGILNPAVPVHIDPYAAVDSHPATDPHVSRRLVFGQQSHEINPESTVLRDPKLAVPIDPCSADPSVLIWLLTSLDIHSN